MKVLLSYSLMQTEASKSQNCYDNIKFQSFCCTSASNPNSGLKVIYVNTIGLTRSEIKLTSSSFQASHPGTILLHRNFTFYIFLWFFSWE
jgi:hypothetical protein